MSIILLQVYAAVSQLVESPLCMEAVSVLEAVLQSSTVYGSVHSETPPTANLQENGTTNNAPRYYARRPDDSSPSPQRNMASQNSLKLRAPVQHVWTGSAGPVPSGGVSPVAADILPSRFEDTTRFYALSSCWFLLEGSLARCHQRVSA